MSLTESIVEEATLEWFGELGCAVILSAVRRGLSQKLGSRKIGDASFGKEVSE